MPQISVVHGTEKKLLEKWDHHDQWMMGQRTHSSARESQDQGVVFFWEHFLKNHMGIELA